MSTLIPVAHLISLIFDDFIIALLSLSNQIDLLRMQTTRYNPLNLPENQQGNLSIISRESRPSIQWKISHGLNTMFGGIFLTGGSSMYFSEIIQRSSIVPSLGGWFLSLGSFFLLVADFQEYFYHYSKRYVVEFRLKRTTEQWKSLSSACGSAFYVLGSILLIPYFDQYVNVGNWLIIVGSLMIFFSSIWKIDRENFVVNLFVGLGGLFYFLGIIYILSGFKMDNLGMNISAALCVTGGSCFFLASLFLHYEYFFSKMK